jgi:hypothetical protein
MSLQYYDRDFIEAKIGEAAERTEELLQDMQRDLAKSAGRQEQMLEVFNRVATALTALTEEVKGLRRDLNPELDKTKKLAAPKMEG